MSFMSPKAPALPPAAPPPPALNDPAVEEARRRELEAASKAKGRRSTLLTGGEGVEAGNIGKKTLLGG